MQFACICVKTCKFSNLYIVCEHSVIMPRNKEANKQDGARQSPGIILQCQRCSHQWTYTGRNPYFTLCTYCKTTVRLKKSKIEDLESRCNLAQVGAQDRLQRVENTPTKADEMRR